MAVKKTPARRKPARKKISRKAIARKPLRGGTWYHRAAARLALIIISHAEKHRALVRTRKDAAILRATHAGCAKCHGTGTLYTKGKDGAFTGSKPCPATPTATKVSRYAVARQARFGVDKSSGLIGWRCPCGKKERPRYRDAKEATKAIRTHERDKHGGQSVGARWYAQLPEGAAQITGTPTPAKQTPKPKGVPATRIVSRENSPYDPKNPAQEHRRNPVNHDPKAKNQHSGLTDSEWVKQGDDREIMPGECKHCRGTTYLPVINSNANTDYDRQIFIRCTECVAGRVSA
ncbi:hypothetical protein OG539_32740 [Actinacidiphila glaucinigra]|uniref:hypothetical protein n=1 Tax=Actinacidiphila glaucinigra TaxID=235986 RepID=UPI00324BAE40